LLLAAALALPLPGQAPPGRGRVASNPNHLARYEAMAAQARFHAQQKRKNQAKGGGKALNPAAIAFPAVKAGAAGVAAAPASSWTSFMPRASWLQPGLKAGLLLLAVVSQPTAIGVAAQGPGLLDAWATLQGFNLSAPKPPNVFAAQAVNLALARANGTGVFPPMGPFMDLLARSNPSNTSILQTLPPFVAQPSPAFPEADLATPVAVADVAAGKSQKTAVNDEIIAVLGALNAAQLTEVYYLLASTGIQLIAESALLIENVPVSAALGFAGNEILSMAHAAGALASQVQVESAQYALAVLVNATKAKPAKPELAPTAPEAAPAGASGRYLDPSLIYGTWKRLENRPSGEEVLYRITRNELVIMNSATDDQGDQAIQTEIHPGAVEGYVSYRLPAGQTQAAGRVKVAILVKQASGSSLTMNFYFLKAGEEASAGAFDVLVEQEGDGKAFLRIGAA
jgi:hypothetical protein